MDKKVSKTVSMPQTWWELIDSFEIDRSKYIQGLVAENFKDRGIVAEGEESTNSDLALIREAKAQGIDVRQLIETALTERVAS